MVDGESKKSIAGCLMNESCVVCRKKHDVLLPQWWNLTDYHGVNGIYCPACFEKVRHKDGKPVHPIAYRNALINNGKISTAILAGRRVVIADKAFLALERERRKGGK